MPASAPADYESHPFEDHLSAPRGLGRLKQVPHAGAAGGAACGDLVRVAVEISGDRVVEAGFDACGCDAVRAAGSAVVELVRGAPVLAAARTTADDAAATLGGLDPARRHAAVLAVDALHRALGSAAAAGCARLAPSPRRTLVAMSGGVDSAVAAQLALEAGHEVVAVTLELWADPATDGERSCCSPQALSGARALAHRMGLPHLTFDLRARFRSDVVADFISEHAAGRTPNPCVRCNGLVRFDEMLRLADDLGAARLATGHYARVALDPEGPLLSAAADPAKDQTYMLSRLDPEQLGRLWFPLAHMRKEEVREHARRSDLPVADRRESQDLCFLSGIGREAFLARHGPPKRPGPGEIVNMDGEVLGHHAGHHGFTVGQRRGLGVAAAEPLFVVGKEPRANRVVVGPRSALGTTRVALRDALLHRPAGRVDRVKLRYRSSPVRCRVEESAGCGAHERLTLRLDDPVGGAAPGQTACLMAGERVVGSALIEEPGEGERRVA